MNYNKECLIVTTQRHKNFGTFLQCYALQFYIESLGMKVQILDYVADDYKLSFYKRLRILLGGIRRTPFKYFMHVFNSVRILKRNIFFKKFFKKYIHITEQKFKTYNDICKNIRPFSIYIAGSDQIWNPRLGGFRDAYFLKFVPENSKKISYASSFGVASLTKEELLQLKKLLDDFDYISCRESSGVDIIANAGFNATKVLDPTLLLPAEHWTRIADKNMKIKNKDFILSYFLSNSKQKQVEVKTFSATMPIIDITADYHASFSSILEIGPSQFLELIRNCSIMITDSFHGVVFSIIFRKEFYVMPRDLNNKDSQETRIVNLLEELGLQNRWCPDFSIPLNIPKIDYVKIESILEKQILCSNEYLRKSLCQE